MFGGEALIYSNPSTTAENVLRLSSFTVAPTIPDGHLLLNILYAPVNPQDHIVIADQYPIKPSHSIGGGLIPGYDGVACVRSVGLTRDMHALKEGDVVVPASQGFGTFRTHAIVKASEVIKISTMDCLKQFDPLPLGLLRMSVCPAYFMIEDIKMIKPGEWIICNCGTGSITQMIIQFAHRRGAKVACIYRSKDYGQARTIVPDASYTEEELAVGDLAQNIPPRKYVLAFDGLSGPSAERVLDMLSPAGVFVNYGALSGSLDTPFDVSSRLLFARGITMRGFKSSESMGNRSPQQLQDLLQWLTTLFLKGELQCPDTKSIPWHGNDRFVPQAFGKTRGRSAKRVLAIGKAQLT